MGKSKREGERGEREGERGERREEREEREERPQKGESKMENEGEGVTVGNTGRSINNG